MEFDEAVVAGGEGRGVAEEVDEDGVLAEIDFA